MTIKDWKKVVDNLTEYKNKTGISPHITVWGGEPLVSPYFDELVLLLKEKNFKVSIITNGVLIDEHRDIIQECVDKIYISIDGIKAIHDEIRGEGIFDKVMSNIQLLKDKDITVMSVITPKLIDTLEEFLDLLNKVNITELYLQDMIGLTTQEIDAYKKWLKETFGISATDIDSWENNGKICYHEEISQKLSSINKGRYSYQIVHKSHGDKRGHCLSSQKRAHVAWNGNVLYCTDFYDFSAGNVKEEKLTDIFENDLTKRYTEEIAKDKCVTCRHCSWRELKDYF